MKEKISFLEEKSRSYKDQLAEMLAKSESLRDELDQNMMRAAFLETTVQELQNQIEETESKWSLSISGNELLVATNAQLKSRVDELQELHDAAVSEKEVTALELASHVHDFSELRGQHMRALELHSTAENQRTEAEKQLEEASRCPSQKDAEVIDLKEKIAMLEGQLRIQEGNVVEASEISAKEKDELKETISKLKQLEAVVEEVNSELSRVQKENEGLAKANLKLTEELVGHESKLNPTMVKLSAILAEKDEAVKQHQSEKNESIELVKRLMEEVEALKSQNGSLTKEKKALEEAHGSSRREHQAGVVLIEEQLKDKQTGEDALRVEIENLEQKLQIVESMLSEKESAGVGWEVRSQDIGSSVLKPSKRKSKKKAEGSDNTTIATATSTKETRVQTGEVSLVTTLKFIIGVALVSVIVGIILGKKY